MAAPQQRLRYDRVRVADAADDQKTAAQIVTGGTGGSVTQEDLQEFLLSQVKRIIFGADTGNWYEDFQADSILSLKELSTSERVENVHFTYTTGSPLVLQQVFPGQVLNRCTILLTTSFDDPAAFVQVGTTTTPSLVFSPAEVTLGVVNNYDQHALFEFSVMDFLQLTISPGASTQGAGLLLYKIK